METSEQYNLVLGLQDAELKDGQNPELVEFGVLVELVMPWINPVSGQFCF